MSASQKAFAGTYELTWTPTTRIAGDTIPYRMLLVLSTDSVPTSIPAGVWPSSYFTGQVWGCWRVVAGHLLQGSNGPRRIDWPMRSDIVFLTLEYSVDAGTRLQAVLDSTGLHGWLTSEGQKVFPDGSRSWTGTEIDRVPISGKRVAPADPARCLSGPGLGTGRGHGT